MGQGPKRPKKGPKRLFFNIFCYFLAVFPYIWPLAGPNIPKKGWPLLGKALERVWEGFGKAQLSSRDQVGCLRSLQEDQIQRTKIQGSAPAGRPPLAEPSSGRFPGSWSRGFGLPRGCASSRLDHSFRIPSCTHRRQPLSGSCRIEIMYHREWQIAIPASLMRVDE